ncbi:hypothetical protein E4U16_001643 [Claviceps sp. LM84 group G4]|nr:hypothetical protein E4U16_001643 [Claviceps sp. LM84 group G4]
MSDEHPNNNELEGSKDGHQWTNVEVFALEGSLTKKKGMTERCGTPPRALRHSFLRQGTLQGEGRAPRRSSDRLNFFLKKIGSQGQYQ